MPFELIDGLIDRAPATSPSSATTPATATVGLAALLKAGRRPEGHLLVSAAGRPYVFDALYRAGKIELELVPQGNLAERIRAAGAGIGAFFTPDRLGTDWPRARRRARSTAASTYSSIRSTRDVALIKAQRGDRWGNLVYRKTARNFGPVMATAATTHGRAGARDRARSASSTPRPSSRRASS